MKATLEFNLPADSGRLEVAIESERWHQIVYNIRRYFEYQKDKATSSKEHLAYMQVARYIDEEMEIKELTFTEELIEL